LEAEVVELAPEGSPEQPTEQQPGTTSAANAESTAHTVPTPDTASPQPVGPSASPAAPSEQQLLIPPAFPLFFGTVSMLLAATVLPFVVLGTSWVASTALLNLAQSPGGAQKGYQNLGAALLAGLLASFAIVIVSGGVALTALFYAALASRWTNPRAGGSLGALSAATFLMGGAALGGIVVNVASGVGLLTLFTLFGAGAITAPSWLPAAAAAAVLLFGGSLLAGMALSGLAGMVGTAVMIVNFVKEADAVVTARQARQRDTP